jgi:putative addiction module killer protein
MNKKILLFQTRDGSSPFLTWLNKLKNKEIRARLLARIDRLKLGHYGVSKKLRKGISELKIDTGACYRIYFAERGNEVIYC